MHELLLGVLIASAIAAEIQDRFGARIQRALRGSGVVPGYGLLVEVSI
jgi:hypothetical protein